MARILIEIKSNMGKNFEEWRREKLEQELSELKDFDLD